MLKDLMSGKDFMNHVGMRSFVNYRTSIEKFIWGQNENGAAEDQPLDASHSPDQPGH